MPSEKTYSASEIADMRLPGLPKTKARVIDRATAEGWSFVEAKGIGGTKRLYTLPDHYLTSLPQTPDALASVDSAPDQHPSKVVGTVAGRSKRVDVEKLELAMKALSEWENTRNVSVSAERRPAVIAILYDYLVKSEEEGGDGMEVVFRALG